LGTFVQVIEGEEDVIHSLYGRIKEDCRHHRVNRLYLKKIEARSFSQWRMGFRNLSKLPQEEIKGFSSFLVEENPNDFLVQNSQFVTNMLHYFKNTSREFID
jgi:hypothetical protein